MQYRACGVLLVVGVHVALWVFMLLVVGEVEVDACLELAVGPLLSWLI